MRVFLTGATGLVGTALVPELIRAGHSVVGLTRSDSGAKSLTAAGAEVLRGTIEDQKILRNGAELSDGVIHCAFDHDFPRFAENAEIEKRAIAALGTTLVASDRPFIVSSGLGLASSKRPVTEDVDEPAISPYPRVPEQIAREMRLLGVT